ncbi:MAG: 6-phosphogluconolactonase [Gelidibacter sp.]|uniref:6-phosphogluconolactonase n=1 Tax=Gelidibacter sp. TaxID=2018083 RepID=UPI0032658BED
MKNLEIYQDTGDLIKALAKVICETSQEAIDARGQFNFVLSGGSSPKKLYELLASKPYQKKIDWDNTYFFFGDERYVSADDKQRNSIMAEETLFKPLKVEESHIFKVDTTCSPEDAAQRYAKSIATHFQKKPVVFDFILLGLGDNAHTASLFPNTAVLEETEATIKSVFVKEVHMYRITMTAPLINQARHIAFLVFGEGKAEAVYHVLHNNGNSPLEYPAKLIHPKKGCLYWFLDTNAFTVIEQKDNEIIFKKI